MTVQTIEHGPTLDQLRSEVDALRAQIAQLTAAGHELVSTQTRMQSLLHRASDAIIQFESDGTISSFNSAAERVFDYAEIELLHQHGEQLFLAPARYRRNVPGFLLEYVRNTDSQYDRPLVGLRRDGSQVLLEVSIAEIEANDLVLFDDFGIEDPAGSEGYEAFLCILRDITERKRVDEELRLHRENLEFLVEEQVREIHQARRRAEQASHAKSAFLAKVSHELRTPMHAILSYSEFGVRKSASAPPARLEEYFSRIHTAGGRLLDMINDLLDLSKAEAGRLDYAFARANLIDIIRGVLHEFESLVERRELRFDCVDHLEDPHLVVDAQRIGQVIRNLLSNALKFSPPRGLIRIDCRDAALTQGKVTRPAVALRVSDQGPGVPEDELDSIFGMFEQSSRNDRRESGTGLGLAISREIVNAHAGRISARNNVDGGACFEMVLPRTRPERQA
jgi:PAS domain S-box-containing protein